MQAARKLVLRRGEFATGVQDSHHDFEGRETRALVMFFYGDAAPIIFDGDGSIGVDGDAYRIGIARHDLVDTVIDDLIDEVVKATMIGCTDVHARAHTYRFQPFKNLNVLFAIIAIAISIPDHFSAASTVANTTSDFRFSMAE